MCPFPLENKVKCLVGEEGKFDETPSPVAAPPWSGANLSQIPRVYLMRIKMLYNNGGSN